MYRIWPVLWGSVCVDMRFLKCQTFWEEGVVVMFISGIPTLCLEPVICEAKPLFWPKSGRLCLIYTSGTLICLLFFNVFCCYRTWPNMTWGVLATFIWVDTTLCLEPTICEGKHLFWVKLTRLSLIYISPRYSSVYFIVIVVRLGT